MNVSYCKTVVQPLRRKIRWHTLVAKGVGPLGGPVGEVLWDLFYLSEMVSFLFRIFKKGSRALATGAKAHRLDQNRQSPGCIAQRSNH